MNQHEKQTAALKAEVAALKRRVEALEAVIAKPEKTPAAGAGALGK